jgi:hypothetical protein
MSNDTVKDAPQSATADAAPPTTVHIPTGTIISNVAYLSYGQMEDGLKRLHIFALCYRPTNNNITWVEWWRTGPDPRHEVLNMDAGLKVDRLFVGIAGNDLLFSTTAHQLIVQPPGVPGTARLAGVWAPLAGGSSFVFPPVPDNPTFIDVPKASPFYDEIEEAVAMGIVSGYTDINGNRVFKPGLPVNRAQAVAMVMRSLHAVFD